MGVWSLIGRSDFAFESSCICTRAGIFEMEGEEDVIS